MNKSRLVRLLLTLALPCLLLIASARLLLSYEFLRIDYTRRGFPADPYGFSTADRLQYGMYAIDYLLSAEPIGYLGNLRLPLDLCWRPPQDARNCPLFNENELWHLQDVKAILELAFTLALFCALLILGAILLDWRLALDGLRRGAWLTLLLITALGVVSLAAWDGAFDRFHEVFFAAGTWRFPYTDSLIRLYPEQLFVDAAVGIALLTAAGACLVLAVCHWRLTSRAGI